MFYKYFIYIIYFIIICKYSIDTLIISSSSTIQTNEQRKTISKPRIFTSTLSIDLQQQQQSRQRPLRIDQVINQKFKLLEVIDHERLESFVDLLPNGEAVIRDVKKSARAIVHASWKWMDAQRTIQIAIERIYKGKVSQYSIMSTYRAERAIGSLIISGQVIEELKDPDSENNYSEGKFVMIPLSCKNSLEGKIQV